ncbi:UbiA prenyltransferase family [Pisolithus marmoratus]|nr:UbiA prenyltransferase family [Pisolithus marmoratus]
MTMPGPRVLFPRLAFYLETTYLFTRSDYKTIFFPVIISAIATAPPAGVKQLIHTAIWVWIHLLQANVSNQTFSAHEDVVNKPWRPLPSGRITVDATWRFRWFLLVVCLYLSRWYGTGVLSASAALSLVEIFHDDFGFSSHPVLKNLCNVGGYLTFELGAVMIISSKASVDHTSLLALLSSGLLIFTTIHAQDFADADGDRLSGRRTLPIVAPEGSRLYMLAALPAWSIALSVLWGLGPLCGTLFLSMGLFVGSQYFRFRDVQHDQSSYLLYNVWLLAAHVLPMNARSRLLIW